MQKIVCLGDSLTYGFGVGRPQVWTRLVAQQTGIDLVNRGINGDTSAGMLARFGQDVEAERPGLVFLMGGANDIILGAGTHVARSNLAAMAHRAVARGITPLMGIPLPFSLPVREDWASLVDFSIAQAEYQAYAEWLIEFCSLFSIPYVNFNAAFPAAVVQQGRPYASYFIDGLHPSPEGHVLIADIFVASLSALKQGQ